jgi:hypothetical protein
MEVPLATCTEEEHRSEDVKPIEIYRPMKVQYGDACLSLQQVYGWTKKFMNGVSSVSDSPRPGQAHQVVTLETIAAVETIVKESGHVTVNEIAVHLDISRGAAHSIVCDVVLLYKYLMFNKLIKIYGFHLTHLSMSRPLV